MLSSFFKRFFKKPKPVWKCVTCGKTCFTIKDLKCGDPDATFVIPMIDNEGNKYSKIVRRSACPLDYIEN